MPENQLINWINSDLKLKNLLEAINTEFENEKDKAKAAFDRLSQLYNLPKYPDEIESRELYQVGDFHLYSNISMYEILGKLKFANNNLEDLKSNVLLAAYLIVNKLEPDISDELDSYLGENYLSGYGYKGDNVNVELIPIIEGESWFDKGCKYFIKED